MKRGLLIVLGFVALTLLLSLVWEEYGLRVAYGRFLRQTGRPLFDLLGLEGVRIMGLRTRYINWIPFVGLLAVTPGLDLRRRALGLAIGFFVFWATHLALNLTQVRGAGQLSLVPLLLSDALPFLLWLLIAHPVVRPWLASAFDPPDDSKPSAGEP